jgi:hypothetical protein
MSIGHSSSAYSLPCVIRPMRQGDGSGTITACQPQNTKAASRSLIRRTWQVRCTM